MSRFTRLAVNDVQEEVIATIERWAEKIGKPIVGGIAQGKNYETVVLDLTYQGCEIYVHANGWDDTDFGNPGVTVNDVHIKESDFLKFKNAALNS